MHFILATFTPEQTALAVDYAFLNVAFAPLNLGETQNCPLG